MKIEIDLGKLNKSHETITEDHFGLNHIFEFEKIGDKAWQTFDEIVEQITPGILRYPGGRSTEVLFDMSNPESSSALDEKGILRTLTPLSEFLNFCFKVDSRAIITIPVSQLLTTGKDGQRDFDLSKEQELRKYVEHVLSTCGPAVIKSFELGNEYESFMYPQEYGKASSAAALIIDQEIEKYYFKKNIVQSYKPEIIVQAWTHCANGGISYDGLYNRNLAVMAQFDERELAAIDGVVSHFYYNPGHNSGLATEHSLENIDKTIELSVEIMNAWEFAARREISTTFSEWNVQKSAEEHFGAKQAAPIVGMFAAFLRAGVDDLAFWSSQYHPTSLATNSGRLQVAGEIFNILQSQLMGASVVGKSINEKNSTVNLFERDGVLTVVVSSTTDKSQSVHIDFDVMGIKIIGEQRLIVDSARTDSIYRGIAVASIYDDPDAYFNVFTRGDATVSSRGQLDATLSPYEVAFYQLSLPPGVHIPFAVSDPVEEIDYARHQKGSAGRDLLIGTWQADLISAIDGADTLRGNAGNDTLMGGADSDMINGGQGNDLVDGGLGIDTAIFKGNNRITVSLENRNPQNTGNGVDKLVGIENIISDAGNDRLVGDHKANQLSGLAGDDVLLGGTGNDTLFGGSGNDSLFGGAGQDRLWGGLGYDTALFSGSDNKIISLEIHSPQNTGNGFDTLINIENLISDSGNDRLTGNSLANTLSGMAGSDLLFGRAGSDRVYGGQGNDKIFGGAGNDTLSGGFGNDLMDGQSGVDTVAYSSKRGIDVDLYRSTYQWTGEGFDKIVRVENVVSGDGGDHIFGNSAANKIMSGGGDDFLLGRGGRDTLYGGFGNDSIYGGLESDDLFGGNGNDKISGGAGGDVLCGGFGSDTLVGGAGDDEFVFMVSTQLVGNKDVIVDFRTSRDVVIITHSEFNSVEYLIGIRSGRISEDQFQTGSRALDEDDRIIYNPISGHLYYDPDGAGSRSQISIGVLLGGPSLSSHDVIIA